METISILTTENNTQIERRADSSQIIKTRVESLSDVSDGYHTIAELYDHRVILFIALCRFVHYDDFARHPEDKHPEQRVWRSKLHHDGTVYPGWFLLGINKEQGKQISYHIPLDYWRDTEDIACTLEQAPVFDSHTAIQVLERLKHL